MNCVSYICYFVVSEKVGDNRKLLASDQRCKRGRILYEVREKAADVPRCHNYL